MRTISQFTTQNLSNTVWAYATLKVAHGQLSPSLSGRPDGDERGVLPSTDDLDFAGDGDDLHSYTAEEICGALDLQGFSCVPVEAVCANDAAGLGALDAQATTVAAFGSSEPVEASGVLVLADGRYWACVMEISQGGQLSLSLRDVVSGAEWPVSTAEFAEHVLRYKCFRVARKQEGG
mmetsp:Transcript_120893/g.219808  ORF Transcript_120893/g.219808 Transcript_120893/m.219808 type:complete len:178 (+) Transcript_120893:21-554(+)